MPLDSPPPGPPPPGIIIIICTQETVVFTGGLIAPIIPYPIIHLEKNGTSEGWIQSVKGMVALDANFYVPGHGNVQTKAISEASWLPQKTSERRLRRWSRKANRSNRLSRR